MAIFVEEFAGMAAGNSPQRFQGVPQLPSNAANAISSGGAVSTITIASNTLFVSIFASANGFLIMGGSSTASTAAGSTSFIPANVQLLRGVKPLAKLFVWST